MDRDALTAELRLFVLTYAEHDPDCPGINANAWEDQKQACVCGLGPRLDELMASLDERLSVGLAWQRTSFRGLERPSRTDQLCRRR